MVLLEPSGCWERAPASSQPTPKTLEAQRHPSCKLAVLGTSGTLGSVQSDEHPKVEFLEWRSTDHKAAAHHT
eukprot:6546915-Alexandrium_andersonii.AAC.1